MHGTSGNMKALLLAKFKLEALYTLLHNAEGGGAHPLPHHPKRLWEMPTSKFYQSSILDIVMWSIIAGFSNPKGENVHFSTQLIFHNIGDGYSSNKKWPPLDLSCIERNECYSNP